MRFFTGQHERTIDSKNRIQLPAQLRAVIGTDGGESSLYVTLGHHVGTLSIYPEVEFEALASRMETEHMSEPESLRFELQFYAFASSVDLDKQGRFVLPDRLVKKAKLPGSVLLVGQKTHIDVWSKPRFEHSAEFDWDGDDWPRWHKYIRMRPERDLKTT